MAKTYATVADLEAILGRTLTASEAARAQDVLEAATVAFDRATGQSFADGAPITAETLTAYAADLWLRRYPVTSIQAVRARSGWIGAPSTSLVAGESYELIDPVLGRLRVGSWCGLSSLYSVDYTPQNVPPPPDVVEATAQWALWGMQSTLVPGSVGVDTVSVGDVSIRYGASRTAASLVSVPEVAVPVVTRYRRTVFA